MSDSRNDIPKKDEAEESPADEKKPAHTGFRSELPPIPESAAEEKKPTHRRFHSTPLPSEKLGAIPEKQTVLLFPQGNEKLKISRSKKKLRASKSQDSHEMTGTGDEKKEDDNDSRLGMGKRK